jgi:hypothetical protein
VDPAPSTESIASRVRSLESGHKWLLVDETYETLTRTGEAMTTAETVTYAYDQIDEAQAELARSG